jgi:hypothetical protein
MSDISAFDQKWKTAQGAPKDTEVQLTPQHVEVSLPQVLDRYVAYLERQVHDHSIEQGVCDELCQQVHQLKNTIAKLDTRFLNQVIV